MRYMGRTSYKVIIHREIAYTSHLDIQGRLSPVLLTEMMGHSPQGRGQVSKACAMCPCYKE